MKAKLLMAAAALGALLAAPGVAAAANAFATGNVNMRAGPSTQYPRITTIPAGAAVTIYGCTSGWRWCDTSWRGARGWVAASYLQTMYRERRVYLPDYGPRVGVPIISFHFGNYWDRWYRDRPWYRDRDRWDGDWRDDDRDRDHDRDRDRDRSGPDWSDNDRDRRNVIEWDRRDPRRPVTEQQLEEMRQRSQDGRRGPDFCPPGLERQGRC